MKTLHRTLIIICSLGVMLCFASCNSGDDDSDPKLPPTITSLSPLYSLPGESVTISGANFSAVMTENIVTINGSPATVTSATTSSLIVVVPDNATTGKITVTVGDGTATSTDDFEVLKDIPRNGLVAFYPLDGNAGDLSLNNLDGTVTGAVAAPGRFGTAGKSLRFDGVNDFVSMGNPAALQINNTITVAGWFNINAYKAGNQMQAIVTKIYFDPDQGGNPTRGYRVSQDFFGNGTPTLYAGCYSSTGLPLSTYVGTSISTATWTFFALVIDGKTYRFYQNGTLTNEATLSIDTNILDDGLLGDLNLGTYGGGFFFDGCIDDLTIYNRALSGTEITQVYGQTVSKY
jgi:hypothetical protein